MAVINWVQFNDNFQYYDQAIITEVINIFIEEYDVRISNLQKNIDEKDFTAMAFNAHSLKSVIANYMAPSAYEASRKLEEMAKNNSEEGIAEVFLLLKRITHELLLELKEYIHQTDRK